MRVELTNACTFAFPARLAQGVEHASDDDLAQVEILGLGLGLRWERLDVDLSVPGPLAGLFGTKAFMDPAARWPGGIGDFRRQAGGRSPQRQEGRGPAQNMRRQ